MIERTDYRSPPESAEDSLVDDRLENKQTTFDPALVDRRPFEGWLINSSDAVIRLDVAMVRPDSEGYLLVLRPSYTAALDEARRAGVPAADILPSVNLIDGKAKQFDDGLYAALDQAYYRGLKERLTSHVQLIRGIYDEVGPASPAAPLLAAGLELAGVQVEAADAAAKDTLLQQFTSNEVQSKPIGFYTWNPTLKECFRFLRFFQQPIRDRAAAQAIADALSRKQDAALGLPESPGILFPADQSAGGSLGARSDRQERAIATRRNDRALPGVQVAGDRALPQALPARPTRRCRPHEGADLADPLRPGRPDPQAR